MRRTPSGDHLLAPCRIFRKFDDVEATHVTGDSLSRQGEPAFRRVFSPDIHAHERSVICAGSQKRSRGYRRLASQASTPLPGGLLFRENQLYIEGISSQPRHYRGIQASPGRRCPAQQEGRCRAGGTNRPGRGARPIRSIPRGEAKPSRVEEANTSLRRVETASRKPGM